MPRPIKDDPRDCFKTFRFTEAEVTRLETRARASGVSLSAYVRGKVLDPSDSDAAPSADLKPGQHPPAGATPQRPQRRSDFATRTLTDQLRGSAPILTKSPTA